MFWPHCSSLASWRPIGHMLPDVGVAYSRMKFWPRTISWDARMEFSASELPVPSEIRSRKTRSEWTYYSYSITASRI
jgi:hypothetical protein